MTELLLDHQRKRYLYKKNVTYLPVKSKFMASLIRFINIWKY